MNFKQRYPFRIGCTSYVLPDELLPNVEYMADKVDDIELVLFESNKWSNMPDAPTISSMQHIADKNDITFSVHFPIDCRAGAADPAESHKFLTWVTDIIRLTKNLPVSGYLLHLEGLEDEKNDTEVKRWKTVTDSFCREVLETVHVAADSICIENLGYDPLLHRQLIDKYHFSHCVDLGHLWKYHPDWLGYCKQVIAATRIIHLHGVDGTTDHRSLEHHTQQDQLQQLIPVLRNFTGVVTLEVFSETDTFSSLQRFEDLWQQ